MLSSGFHRPVRGTPDGDRVDEGARSNGMKQWPTILGCLALAGLLVGCAKFQSRPISAERRGDTFRSRGFDDEGLRAFLETNGVVGTWPRARWDLDSLTLAGFYHHPEMEMARARWQTVTAGKITARQRPNPNLSFIPRFNSSSLGTGLTPWILGGFLDIPIETMGKRRYRTAQAEQLAEMAHYDLAAAAWVVRGRIRTALIALQAARETASLLAEQVDALSRVARLVELQWEAGAVSPVEVSVARIAHQNALLGLKDTRRQEAVALGQLAEAIGVPLRAFEGIEIAFASPSELPTELAAAEIQRRAMLNRADVLSALAEYAASESALRVQIARQYPDIHLRPGYELDQDRSKWQLGIGMDLPVFHQNQGPIAEAEARRGELAAKFDVVQARAIGEIDRTTAVYSAAIVQATTADSILADLGRRNAAMARMYEAGEVDGLAVASAESDRLGGAVARVRAYLLAQQSLAALESAVQAPLLMPLSSVQLENPPRNPTPPNSP